VAPDAGEWAAFEKDDGPDAGSIVEAVALYLENQRFGF